MLATELRAHLRIRTDRPAILRDGLGGQVRCVVHDISMGGAYLVQGGSSPHPRHAVGDVVEVELGASRLGIPLIVEAEVVRVQPGGPGLAVRFRVYDDLAEDFVQHVMSEARTVGVATETMGAPVLQLPRSSGSAVGPVLRRLAPIAAIGLLWWAIRLVTDWLGAVL